MRCGLTKGKILMLVWDGGTCICILLLGMDPYWSRCTGRCVRITGLFMQRIREGLAGLLVGGTQTHAHVQMSMAMSSPPRGSGSVLKMLGRGAAGSTGPRIDTLDTYNYYYVQCYCRVGVGGKLVKSR